MKFLSGSCGQDIFNDRAEMLWRRNMKESLLSAAKGLCSMLLVFTLVLACFLAARGELVLMGAVFVGYAVGAVFIWNMAYRIWSARKECPEDARRVMAWGMCLRFGVLILALATAAQISAAVFAAAVGGFLGFYVSAFLQIARAGGRD